MLQASGCPTFALLDFIPLVTSLASSLQGRNLVGHEAWLSGRVSKTKKAQPSGSQARRSRMVCTSSHGGFHSRHMDAYQNSHMADTHFWLTINRVLGLLKNGSSIQLKQHIDDSLSLGR